MFSVPGWKLSAPLVTQIEAPKPPAPEGKKKSKKRKRQEQERQLQEEVNAANLGEQWGKIVEAKDTESEVKPAVAGNDTAQPLNGAPDKKSKKRKRNKGKKGAQEEQENQQVNGDAEEEFNGFSASEPEPAPSKPAIADAAAMDDTTSHDNKRHKKNKQQKKATPDTVSKAPSIPNTASSTVSTTLPTASLLPEPKGLTPLQKSMRTKLASARFRHLNESLYTKPSAESLSLFTSDPSMFEDYHRGFAQQVEVWPENPVDGYVQTIQTRASVRPGNPYRATKNKFGKKKNGALPVEVPAQIGVDKVKPLPRNMKGRCTIADLGCGTASLSYALHSLKNFKSLNLSVQSFDLSKPSGPSADLVTVADISALPLEDATVDVAIFCLALMGTNWLDFIDEAWRILRWKGELWVAEIKSRFGRVEKRKAGKPPINSVGSLRKVDKTAKGKKKGNKSEADGIAGSDDEAELATHVDGAEGKEGTDVSAFVEALRKRGFVLAGEEQSAVDLSNKMFVKLQFVKGATPTKGKNAKRDEGAGERRHSGGVRMGIKGRKFTAIGAEDEGDEQDGKVLKPCLYKIR